MLSLFLLCDIPSRVFFVYKRRYASFCLFFLVTFFFLQQRDRHMRAWPAKGNVQGVQGICSLSAQPPTQVFWIFFLKKNQKNIRGVQGFCSLSAQPPTQVSSSYSTDTLIVLKKKSSFFSVVFGSVRDLLSVCTTANAGVLT